MTYKFRILYPTQKQMIKNLRFLSVILFFFISSCTTESNNAERVVYSPINPINQDTSIADSNGMEELHQIKLQLDNGNYSQIDSYVNQVQAYLATGSVQISAKERSGFPQLSKETMIDFLHSIDMEAFRQTGYHEKKYSFSIAPDGYVADSDESPDWIRLSADENTNEFNLLLQNSFLVDQEFGCAESGTVYIFTIEESKLILKRVDFAG